MENHSCIPDAHSKARVGQVDEINANGKIFESDTVENGEDQLNCEQSIDKGNGDCDYDERVILGKVFATMDDAYYWYNQYALRKGFDTRINWNTKSRKTNEIIRKRYVCNKEGFKNMKDVGGREIKRHRDTRTGCGAMMEIKLTESREWAICKFDDTHNHPLTTPSKMTKHRLHSTFSQSVACKSLISDISGLGVKGSIISRTVNTRPESHEDASKCHPSFCCIHARFNKALEDARSHPNLVKKLGDFIDAILVEAAELNRRKSIEADMVCSQIDSTTANILQDISACDLSSPGKNKGCPKVATKIKSSLELIQQTKEKRICGHYGEKDHYINGCSKSKAEMVECQSTQMEDDPASMDA